MTLIKLRWLAGALALWSSPGWAGPASTPPPFDVPKFCTAVEALVVANSAMASRHGSILFLYQALLVEAAGVRSTDSDVEAYARIRAFIDSREDLVCSNPNFVPAHGNVFKLAVARQSSEFIDDALDNWHVDLNRIDAIDGKTVLDFISDRRKAAGSGAFGSALDRYYRRFRAAGARHAAELKAASGRAAPSAPDS